jgi:hypothetical protein
MNTPLERMIGQLERQKAELVRWIEAWPSECLAYKATPSEWSALQVFDHLRKTELAVLHSCKQNLRSREHSVSPSGRAKTAMLLAMMRLPIKLKVPGQVSFVLPDDVTSLQTVLSSWSDERLRLKAFVEALTTADETVGVVFHPAAGWMNLRATVSFLAIHIRHHKYQLQRIKKTCEGAGSS